MSILAKVFVIVNLVFSLAYLSVSGALYHHRQNWRDQFVKVTLDYSRLKQFQDGKITTLENRIDEMNDFIKSLEERISALMASIDDIGQKYRDAKTDLAIETQEMALLLTDHSRIVQILSKKDETIAMLRNENIVLRDKFQEIMAQKNTAENQVARLTKLLMDTRRDLHDLRKEYVVTRRTLNEKKLVLQKLRDYGIPVEKIVLLVPPPPIDGHVAAYDPPTRLVLLNVGKQQGVEEGYEFTIYRGTRFIARVKVEKVLPDMCGARVIFEVAKIQKGDLAATRLH